MKFRAFCSASLVMVTLAGCAGVQGEEGKHERLGSVSCNGGNGAIGAPASGGDGAYCAAPGASLKNLLDVWSDRNGYSFSYEGDDHRITDAVSETGDLRQAVKGLLESHYEWGASYNLNKDKKTLYVESLADSGNLNQFVIASKKKNSTVYFAPPGHSFYEIVYRWAAFNHVTLNYRISSKYYVNSPLGYRMSFRDSVNYFANDILGRNKVSISYPNSGRTLSILPFSGHNMSHKVSKKHHKRHARRRHVN